MKQVYKAPGKKHSFSATAVCLLLTAVLAIGGTLAYLYTNSDTVTNTFNPTDVEIVVVEKVEGNIKSEVKIANTGKADAFIRAKVVITWQDASGNVYPEMPAAGTDYSIEYGSVWTEPMNGFRYYKKSVPAGGLTTDLIVKAEPKKVCEDPAYTLHIEILSQAIQSEGTTDSGVQPVQEKWGVTIANGSVSAYTPTT